MLKSRFPASVGRARISIRLRTRRQELSAIRLCRCSSRLRKSPISELVEARETSPRSRILQVRGKKVECRSNLCIALSVSVPISLEIPYLLVHSDLLLLHFYRAVCFSFFPYNVPFTSKQEPV